MTRMRRRWHACLAWGFVLVAAVTALAHIETNYRSEALARIALWSTILAIVFGAWSFGVRANERWKQPPGFEVIRESRDVPLKTAAAPRTPAAPAVDSSGTDTPPPR
jgi:hypothetical protein